MNWKFGISRCKLLHTEWINNKVLLNSTGNYIQSSVKNHMEKDVSKNTCVCVTESLCWTQKSTGHCKSIVLGIPSGAVGKDLPVSVGDMGLIPGSEAFHLPGSK